MSDLELSKLTKAKFKTIVKSKVRDAALKYLFEIKLKHSKMDNLRYDKLELQSYLSSPMFNNESRNLLLRLRTRTVNGIKSDFVDCIVTLLVPWRFGRKTQLGIFFLAQYFAHITKLLG